MNRTESIPRSVGAAFFSRLSLSNRAGTIRHYVSLLIGVLWLAPVIALLVLNFSNYVIGASVWCPFNNCNIRLIGGHNEEYGGYDYVEASTLDARDHDALGALQLVGKALEVWFAFIAASLVYSAVQLLASHGDGVPIGLLFSHNSYSDPLTFADKSYWVSANKIGPRNYRGSSSFRLYLFMFFTLAMCLLINLIGPAVSVLSIPTLQWMEQPKFGQVFGSFNLSKPPNGPLIEKVGNGMGCTQDNITDRRYDCTYSMYASKWDSIVGTVIGDGQELLNHLYNISRQFTTLPETGLTFAFNTTKWWAYTPTRQTLRLLSNDLEAYIEEKSYMTRQNSSKTALQSKIVREGPVPIILTHVMLATGRIRYVGGDGDKQIRCYNLKLFNSNPVQGWECITAGTKWGPNSVMANFSINANDMFANTSNSSTTTLFVKIFSTSGYATFNSDKGLPACMGLNASTTCNWGSDIKAKQNSGYQQQVLYVEIGTNRHQYVSLHRIFVHTTFALHTVDTQSPVYFVETALNKIPKINITAQKVDYSSFNGGKTVILHPDWLLAAWSSQNEGYLSNSGTARRLFTWNAVSWLDAAANRTNYNSWNVNYHNTLLIVQNTVLQAMSFVPWTNGSNVELNPKDAAKAVGSDKHPILKRYVSVRVWAYGFQGRTAKLGATVAIIAIILTVIRTIVCIFIGTHQMSNMDLFTEALQRPYKGELDGTEGTDLARIRFNFTYENGQLDIKDVDNYRQLEDKTEMVTILPPTIPPSAAGYQYQPEFSH